MVKSERPYTFSICNILQIPEPVHPRLQIRELVCLQSCKWYVSRFIHRWHLCELDFTCLTKRIFLILNRLLNNIEISDPIRRPIFRMLLPYAVTGARFNVE